MNTEETDNIINHIDSIQKLFQNAESINIPAYQRAYSWENNHCAQFLEDIIEQEGKPYYLGQFLFEKQGNSLFIVDGQQRLTTTVILFSVIAKIPTLFRKEESLML